MTVRATLAASGLGVALAAALFTAQPIQGQPTPWLDFALPPAPEQLSPPRQASSRLLLTLIRMDDWTSAANLAEVVLRSPVSDPVLNYLLGIVHWQRGERIEAIQRLRAAETQGLRESYLHQALGLAYYAANQFTLFRQQMQLATALDPRDPRPHFYLGRHAEAVTGNSAAAMRHFERAVALDASDARSQAWLAQSMERMDRREEAAERYRLAARLATARGERFSWPCRGLARLTLGTDPAEAEEWALLGVRAEPEVADNHAVLARAYERGGKLLLAAEAASEAVRLDPDNEVSHYLLYGVLRRLGRPDAAAEHLSRFRALKKVYGD